MMKIMKSIFLTLLIVVFGVGSANAQTIVNAKSTNMTETPRAADAFVNSIGFNVHFIDTNTAYDIHYAAIKQMLGYIGVRHLRDGLVNMGPTSYYYTYLQDLANTYDIKFDLITSMNEPSAVIQNYAALVSPALEAVEAPNEYDLSGDPNYVVDIQTFTKQLYQIMKTAPTHATKILPIFGPSFTSVGAVTSVGNLSSDIWFGNMHDYYSFRNPGNSGWGGYFTCCGVYGTMAFNIGAANVVGAPKPVVSTESGYETGTTSTNQVSPQVSYTVQGKYLPRLLLDHWNAGVVRTYIYDFADDNQNFGVVDANANPKPAYTALANLMRSLSDKGAPVKMVPLTYSISASPTIDHTLLQKRDGSYQLMLWNEVLDNGSLQTQQVTLSFPANTFKTVTAYNWQSDGTFTSNNLQLVNGTVTIPVSDYITGVNLQK